MKNLPGFVVAGTMIVMAVASAQPPGYSRDGYGRDGYGRDGYGRDGYGRDGYGGRGGTAFSRQASIRGNLDRGRGKCTIEVVVDDAAQVEISGTNAVLRTLSGSPAEWRRFECNSPMPPNPVNFRFAGVDGRGRQSLARDPRNNRGTAVILLEDRDHGREGYTFDVFWDYGASGPGFGNPGYGGGNPGYGYEEPRDFGRGRFGVDQAVRMCEDSVYDAATRRFRTRDVVINRPRLDDGPGRNDWVSGTLDVRGDRYRFGCSVDFKSGRLRSTEIDARPSRW